MYITVHAAAGAAIGQFTLSPLLAFILGFLSHLALDTIPHGDQWIKEWSWFSTKMRRTVTASLIDCGGVIITTIIYILFTDINHLSAMFAGVAGAVSPDALWGFYEITASPLLAWYRKAHTRIHCLFTPKLISPLKGSILQAIILFIMAFIVARY